MFLICGLLSVLTARSESLYFGLILMKRLGRELNPIIKGPSPTLMEEVRWAEAHMLGRGSALQVEVQPKGQQSLGKLRLEAALDGHSIQHNGSQVLTPTLALH